MPNGSGGRRKLWHFLTSLFGRHKGEYSLVTAADRDPDTERDSKNSTSRNADPFTKIRKSFFSGRRTYDAVKSEHLVDQQFWSPAGTYRKSQRFVSGSQTTGNNSTENYVAALFKEGLLQWPYSSIYANDPLCIPKVEDHPVLALCYGFQDHELRQNQRRPIQSRRRSPFEFDPYDDSWIQSGLNQVLSDEFIEEEPRIDNIPVSLWMSMIEPALQTLMMYRLGRNRRLNITAKRQQTPMNSLHNTIVRGDSMQQDVQIGPQNQQWALGLIAVFTMRIGELGERQLRHRDTICDMQIPNLNSKTRQRNKCRSKTTLPSTMAPEMAAD